MKPSTCRQARNSGCGRRWRRRLYDHRAGARPGEWVEAHDTTCLHVPSIGLVVAGDAAYNDVHLLLAESNAHTRREWIAALDTIEALHPRAVIAGHKRPGTDDDPRIIEETRQYIRAIDRLAQTTTMARELYDQMLSLYPERGNPGALWSSARALKPEEGKTASGTPWLKPEA